MESKSSKKWSGVFLVLVGAALFLFGYYLGLPQPLIDNNEIASEELPPKAIRRTPIEKQQAEHKIL
jgi:type II secretory pathway component PulM